MRVDVPKLLDRATPATIAVNLVCLVLIAGETAGPLPVGLQYVTGVFLVVVLAWNVGLFAVQARFFNLDRYHGVVCHRLGYLYLLYHPVGLVAMFLLPGGSSWLYATLFAGMYAFRVVVDVAIWKTRAEGVYRW